VKRYFSTMLFPLFDREGAVISIGGIAQEVSDRKRAEAERETLEEQFRQVQKMDAIGRLAGGVAHDFNNMLGVILGFTDMAIEALPADHQAVHDLAQVRAAATHSAELTRQLLAFARKQATAPEVLNLNDAVGSVLKMLGRLIGEDIALIWRPGLNLGPVRLDPTQLDQILANLAVNARDAIHGVGKLVIETEGVTLDALFCEQHPGFLPGRYVLLSVSDDGCGMTHETQTQIFEPFFTTKPLGSGTGLGLSTVYGIVKQNNGFINVNSEPGKGSTFRIYLPYFVTTDESRSGLQKPVEPHGGSETVLLVEDEVGLLELGRRLLERLGYVVIAANGSTQALAASAEYKGPIDLLVTDVIMPDMNGRDLWLRLQADRPGIKSLFMSGYTADVIAHQGALEEGVHFLQKPFTMDAFATKLREALK
jgi:signal transduction histidine kinase/CheY-like chemotaxis protein